MKLLTISFLAIPVLAVVSCGVSKKEATKTAPVAHTAPVNSSSRIAPSVASADGIFAPGNAELTALRVTHKDVTMRTLEEGHKLYTGVCTNCHRAKSIYDRPVAAWPGILTNMAKEAKINDAQKDAIYKYVLAIKATQPIDLAPWGK